MKKKLRLYAMPQGNAENIQCVDKLVIKVGFIDTIKNTIEVLINPNTQHYQESGNRQIFGHERTEDTHDRIMTSGSEPWIISINGTVYAIEVIGIGEEFVHGYQCHYADFEVSW